MENYFFKVIPDIFEADPVVAIAIIVAVLGYLLLAKDNMSNFLELIDKIKSKKLLIAKDYLKDPIKNEDIKTICIEFIEAYNFKELTGIYEEASQGRSALIKFKNQVSHQVTWETIKNAMPYLVITNGYVQNVKKPSMWKRIEYFFLMVYGVFFLLLFSLFIVAALDAKDITFKLILLLFTSCFFLFTAILTINSTRPIRAAKRIKDEFENIKNEQQFAKDSLHKE